ncbi:MAG: hypothetical protein N2249_08755 [Melioribacter sp.]|nr:hypothetical protein [Melioribacter sp.]
MQIKKILLGIFIIFIPVIFSSCCSCKKIGLEENFIKGYITVVGNEPFAKLAIKTDNDKLFILECDNELEKELYKQQGNYFYIQFSETKTVMDMPVIKVINAIPIRKKEHSK